MARKVSALTLPEGMKTTISTEQLVDKRGIHPGYALEVREVRVLNDGDNEQFVFHPDGSVDWASRTVPEPYLSACVEDAMPGVVLPVIDRRNVAFDGWLHAVGQNR